MTFASLRSSPAWIAYGIPAGLLLAVLVLASAHLALWSLAGLAAVALGAAVLLARPWRRFLGGPAAPAAVVGS